MFQKGQTVRWRSQSNSQTTTKHGIIVAIIQPGERPHDIFTCHPYRCMFDGLSRKEVSYLVEVAGKTQRAKKRLYHPRTAALKSAMDEGRDRGEQSRHTETAGPCQSC